MYFMKMSIADIENADITEITFIFDWLVKQKEKEDKEINNLK